MSNYPKHPEPTPRRIVQIAAIPETEKTYQAVYALADDGTLWQGTDRGGTNSDWGWTQLPALPPIPAPTFHGDE